MSSCAHLVLRHHRAPPSLTSPKRPTPQKSSPHWGGGCAEHDARDSAEEARGAGSAYIEAFPPRLFLAFFYLPAFPTAILAGLSVVRFPPPSLPPPTHIHIRPPAQVGYSGDFVYDRSVGSDIAWKEEKDLTREWEIKKQTNNSAFAFCVCFFSSFPEAFPFRDVHEELRGGGGRCFRVVLLPLHLTWDLYAPRPVSLRRSVPSRTPASITITSTVFVSIPPHQRSLPCLLFTSITPSPLLPLFPPFCLPHLPLLPSFRLPPNAQPAFIPNRYTSYAVVPSLLPPHLILPSLILLPPLFFCATPLTHLAPAHRHQPHPSNPQIAPTASFFNFLCAGDAER
ncbi:hypothetical protein B0H19DRAFT_546100 [Mycena capillaripes]|nr:hypothetical protein B0H19DRAFT_546100 [Mycena capillaripes]